MSILANELIRVKSSQGSSKLGANLAQPTILLDGLTARSTSIDVIYTMGLMAYCKLVKQQPKLKEFGEEIFDEKNKDMSRNTLNKEENLRWSEKMIKFMILLGPYLLNEECQKVMEYLLRNYKINIFQPVPLAIIFLQYWNYQIYAKLTSNIQKKLLQTTNLTFLSDFLNSKTPINITYIIKSLTYSHFLLDSLVIYTRQYIKMSTHSTHNYQPTHLQEEIEVKLGEEYELQLMKRRREEQGRVYFIRNDPKRFLLEIFFQIINRKMTAHYKYIIEFCVETCKYATSTNSIQDISNLNHLNNTDQISSMIMILMTRLILENAVTENIIKGIIAKFVLKSLKTSKSQNKLPLQSSKRHKNLFDFIMIIWQRRPECIQLNLLQMLSTHLHFIDYLTNFKSSLYMIFIHVLSVYQEHGTTSLIKILNAINYKIKDDQFYRHYQKEFYQEMFQLYAKVVTANQQPNNKTAKQQPNNKLMQGNRQEPNEVENKVWMLNDVMRKYFLLEMAEYYNCKQISNEQLRQAIQEVYAISKNVLQISKTNVLTFDLKQIPKQIPLKHAVLKGKKQSDMVDQDQEERLDQSQSNQQIVQEQQATSSNQLSVIELIRRQSNGLLLKDVVHQGQVDYANEHVVQVIQLLINHFYSQQSHALSNTSLDNRQQVSRQQVSRQQISRQQKNNLLQKVVRLYTIEMLKNDLANDDFTCGIKYMLDCSQLEQKQSNQNNNNSTRWEMSKACISILSTKISIMDDVLYRQLFRISLMVMVQHSQHAYKEVITYLNSLYKSIVANYIINQASNSMMNQASNSMMNPHVYSITVHNILCRISSEIFGCESKCLKKGKYYKLINNHTRVLVQCIIQLHSRNKILHQHNKTIALSQQLIKKMYNQIVDIFGKDNLYLIHVGVLELLTRKSFDITLLDFFVKVVILGSIKPDQELKIQANQQANQQHKIQGNKHKHKGKIDNQREISFIDHAISVGKTLYFCTQLVQSIYLSSNSHKEQSLEIDAQITSGIAKSIITQFYGLVKDKFKRMLIKKILLFLENTYMQPQFSSKFMTYLQTVNHQNKRALKKILHLYSEIYKILTNIRERDVHERDAQKQGSSIVEKKQGIVEKKQGIVGKKQGIVGEKRVSSIEVGVHSLMDKITNMFPLELRLILFEPLLPNTKLYEYLGLQLQRHSSEKTTFDKLSQLINIHPYEINNDWLLFFKECLKRGYTPNSVLVDYLLNNQQLVQGQKYQNVTIAVEIICQISQYLHCKHLLYSNSQENNGGLLSRCMDLVMLVCNNVNNTKGKNQNNNDDDYKLAIVYRIIRNLGEIISPYLTTLFLCVINMESTYIGTFITNLTTFLVASTLIQLVKDTHKEVTNFKNYAIFLKEVCKKGTGDALSKTIQLFMQRSLQVIVEEERQEIEMVVQLEADVFVEMALKLNENQLRKVIIEYVRWSEVKLDQRQQAYQFNVRKIVLYAIYASLSKAIANLFTPFYGYIFENMMKELAVLGKTMEQQCALNQKASLYASEESQKLKKGKVVPSAKKRQHEISSYEKKLLCLYLSNALHSLQQLWLHDSDHEFLDGGKFDQLSEPLSLIFMFESVGVQAYTALINMDLIPCLISLCGYTSDDYQLKSLNYKILLLLKNKSKLIQLAIFTFMEKLIDQIQDRYLLFVNDLVPFLIELANSKNTSIKTLVKTIVYKIEELSGDKIQNYVQ